MTGGLSTAAWWLRGTAVLMPLVPYSSLALFAAAAYGMSDRLILHGSGVKQLITAPVTPFTPYPVDQLSLGATYKLGENISIGATIQMNNGMGYDYFNPHPFNRYGIQPPFYW